MHVVIVGNGISGITAARFLRKLSDHQITVISEETDFFFSRTALMYIYMGHMRASDTKPYEDDFWVKNRINLVRARVQNVDFDGQKLSLANVQDQKSKFPDPPDSIGYDKLVLATGSKPFTIGWPGQDLDGVGQLYSFQDLLHLESLSSRVDSAVIVGGGLIGIELAEMLHSRHKKVTMLVREKSYWNHVLPAQESQMINRHIKERNIDLHLGAELGEILPDDSGKVKGIRTKDGEYIEAQYVGLTIGVRPNVGFLEESPLGIDRGILVDENLRTNIDNVYAIGDCAQMQVPKKGRRAIEAVWYTGRMMGETVAYTICGREKSYDPGIWFNSAKFLDIEYQVYGHVPAHESEDHKSLLWMSDDGNKSVRIVVDPSSHEVKGFNVMGVRFRHEVCEKWIQEKTKAEEVVNTLGLAFFDPEFYKSIKTQIQHSFADQLGISLANSRSAGLGQVLNFLRS